MKGRLKEKIICIFFYLVHFMLENKMLPFMVFFQSLVLAEMPVEAIMVNNNP
jgi:hypothetical protein